MAEVAIPTTVSDLLRRRKQAYLEVFNSPVGKALLADLAVFCRAHETTFHPDARVAATLDGRREVWLRIQHYLELDLDTLWDIYGSKQRHD